MCYEVLVSCACLGTQSIEMSYGIRASVKENLLNINISQFGLSGHVVPTGFSHLHFTLTFFE